MEKVRYRIVWNRANRLTRQGTAVVQIEARLDGRKVYMTTNVYLKPGCWNRENAEVVNHPHATELNAMLFEEVIRLQGIELGYWKRGVPVTLAMLKAAAKRKDVPTMTFTRFATQAVEQADKKSSTKENLRSTITVLDQFRKGITFKDLSYTFLKAFEQYLREQKLHTNTIAKHMRQLRMLTNEAINAGHIHPDDYPFRKYKIKQVKGRHEHLTPDELRKMEAMKPAKAKERRLLDAFLFCCYTGLRYSDFTRLTDECLTRLHGKQWLILKTKKTDADVKLPLHLLFQGKALDIIARYPSINRLARIGSNSEANRRLRSLTAKMGKRITFHTARHSCAVNLLHQGVPVTTVQSILGHRSVETTKVYAEVLRDTLVRDLQKVKRNKRNRQVIDT